METWKIENNVIVFTPNEYEKIYPSAKELYVQKERYTYKGKEYILPFEGLNIKFNSIGLNTKLEFNIIDGKISIDLYAIKGSEKYKVNHFNNYFMDYIIIDETWYYLSGNYNIYIEIIKKHNINELNNLNFNQYMLIVREFQKDNITYIDNITQEINLIKTEQSNLELKGLQAKLYSYQQLGCRWLNFMINNKCGCILGDEMGLGKTLQIIALLGEQKSINANSHFLVICPVSLLENWSREIKKFYPELTTCVHHGSKRTGYYKDLIKYDIIIMSYSNVQADLSMLNMIEWDIVILDEAQNIKNPYAIRTKTIKELNRKTAIAVTGTPFENHMTDIWSIVDFVIPQYLGKIKEYESEFQDDLDSAYKLESLITPIMLRRRVKDVAKDLPSRIDIPQPIEMTEQEAELYENNRKEQNKNNLKMVSIDKIQKLRMFCTHPLVYDKNLKNIDPIYSSNKYSRLCEILEEIFENKEKAIIFTSFNDMIELIVNDIRRRFGVYTNFINGSVEADRRQAIVDDFSKNNGPGILVLNPKAAGAGLNITCANHVIHYNLEWNPALEDQASARAYRRGQSKTVFIHRLYYANTIEEVINDRIQNKREISETAIIGNKGTDKDKDDLIKALRISPIGRGNNGE